MEKSKLTIKKNGATKFFNTILNNDKVKTNCKTGFIIKTDFKIMPLENETFTLTDMQNAVGGYIELVKYEDELFDLIVDEEGMIKNKGVNMTVFAMTGLMLVGDALFLRKGVLK
jgi:hypothetical protein